jgi:hypothetical protein
LGRLVAIHERTGRGARAGMPRAAASLRTLVAAQLVLGFYFARVAGFQDRAAGAALLALPAGALAVLGAAILSGSRRPSQPR